MSKRTCTIDGCDKPHRSRGYCATHYKRWQAKGHAENRPCPTCGNPIDLGPGQHAYCSEECRPECAFDGCGEPRRGRGELCNMHYAQSLKGGELKPYSWATERVCVVCGKEITEQFEKRRTVCSGSCRNRQLKPDRPDHVDCALCGAEVSLVTPNPKTGKLKRSDSALCPTCKRRPTWAPITIRQLAKRDGTACGICGYEVALMSGGPIRDLWPSIDHIVPRAWGGEDTAENCQLVHLWCNQIKNARRGASGFGPARKRHIAELVGAQ